MPDGNRADNGKIINNVPFSSKKMGIPTDPMILLKGAKAAGIPIYGCAVEAALSGIKEKVPPEIELLEQADLTKPIIEAKKIIGGM